MRWMIETYRAMCGRCRFGQEGAGHSDAPGDGEDWEETRGYRTIRQVWCLRGISIYLTLPIVGRRCLFLPEFRHPCATLYCSNALMAKATRVIMMEVYTLPQCPLAFLDSGHGARSILVIALL